LKGKLRVIDGSTLYLVGALIYFTLGLFFHFEDERLALIAIQFFVALLPPIIYLKKKGLPIKETFRFNRLKVKHAIYIGIITILLYPVAMLGNLIIPIILSLFGDLQPPQVPTPNNFREYFILMVIVSLIAGICEEIFFRGFLLSAYERIGKTKAIIITAVLFGVFHFNIYNLLGPMVLGLVFGYLVFLTNSIFAGIIGHMVNNGFAMTLSFLLNTMQSKFPVEELAVESDMSLTMALISTLIFFVVLSAVTGFLAYLIIEGIKKDFKEEEKKNNVAASSDAPLDISNVEDVDIELEKELEKTEASEFLPLIFIIPLYAYICVVQVKQLFE